MLNKVQIFVGPTACLPKLTIDCFLSQATPQSEILKVFNNFLTNDADWQKKNTTQQQ